MVEEDLINEVDGELSTSDEQVGRITDDVCDSAWQRHLRDMERANRLRGVADLGFDHGAARSITRVSDLLGLRDIGLVTRSLGLANHGFNHNTERALGGIARMMNPTAGFTDSIKSLRGIGGVSALEGLVSDNRSLRDLGGIAGVMWATSGALAMLPKGPITDALFRHDSVIENVSRSVSEVSAFAIHNPAIAKSGLPHAWRASLAGLTEFERVPQHPAFVPIARSRREADLRRETEPRGDEALVTPRIDVAPRESASTTNTKREPSRREPRDELLRQLKRLLPSMFEEVLFRAKAPRAHLPPREAPQATRAIDLIWWAEAEGRFDDLVLALRATLDQD